MDVTYHTCIFWLAWGVLFFVKLVKEYAQKINVPDSFCIYLIMFKNVFCHIVLTKIPFSDIRALQCKQDVDMCREKVYACLDEHCRTKHTGDDGRFAQLLLRLPALRSISLKCVDHLCFFRILSDKQLDSFVMEMLDKPM